jgi:methionine-rich copper-binding protein CopC
VKHTFRAALAAIALGAAAFGAASLASAHAEFDHSTPAPGSILASAPATVEVGFKEEIQALPGSYGLEVTDASGASVTSGSASLGADKMSLSVALNAGLADGTYTVAWMNTSADDGDADEGTFTFSVGTAAPAMPTAMPPDMPLIAPHTHTHDDMPATASETDVAPPTTGLVSAPVTALNDSGVTGRIDVFPVDGGMRTRIDVILSGMAPGSTHVSHVHGSAVCFEGAHVADLNSVTANDQGTGSASTVIDVPFSMIANGKNNVLWHTSGNMDNPGPPIACGVVPAQPAAPAATGGHVTVALPNTGDGSAEGRNPLGWPLLILVAAGLSATGMGAMMQARARR